MTRYALVTGASAGIGRATAVALLQEGFAVCLVGRRQEQLEETAALVPGATSLVIPTDVGDAASVANLFTTLQKSWDRLDVLFNNAGGNVPVDQFRRHDGRAMGRGGRGQSQRRVPRRPRRLPDDARPDPTGRPDHQ